MNQNLLLTVAAIALTACASPKPELVNVKNPAADLAADRWDCQKQIAAIAPATPAPAERKDAVTRCSATGGDIECRSTEVNARSGMVDGLKAGMAARQAKDAADALPNCMAAKGWR